MSGARRLVMIAGAAGAILASCGHPNAPTPVVTVFSLSGTVAAESGAPITGARVSIVSGPNTGREATTGVDGRFAIGNLTAGTVTVQVSATGFAGASRAFTLSSSRTEDFTLVAAVFATQGRVVDALSAAGVSGVEVSGSGIFGVSDGQGVITLSATTDDTDPREVHAAAPDRVERITNLRVPGPDALLSLMPPDFDLTAFDQMFRVPQLLRWTAAPPLAIETRALQFTSVSMTSGTTVDDEMAGDEVSSLVDDLTWALPQLTGGTFSAYASVRMQTSAPGQVVALLNSGQITVARVVGLTSQVGYWGYSRWQWRSDGTVIAGLIMLDRDFERSGSQYLRSLRTHELGHALGYSHVTSRVSVMNSNARTEPTGFDLDAARIAFQRPPGNRSPDTDPSASSINRLSLTVTWSPPIR